MSHGVHRIVSGPVDSSLVWIAALLGWMVSLVILYYTIKYYQNRNHVAVGKRHYKLVICINCLVIILLSIQQPIIQMSDFGTLIDDDSIIPHFFWESKLIFDLLFGYPFIFIIYAIAYLWILRLWLIHYSIKFIVAAKTNDVLQYINDTSPQRDFYIQNKHKYGNTKNALKIFSIPYIISCIIMSVVYYVDNGYSDLFSIVQPIMFLIPIIIASMIWHKTPVFKDFFKISTEIRFCLYGCSIGVVLYVIFNIGELIFDILFLRRIIYLVMIFVLCHICLFTTLFVINNIPSNKSNKFEETNKNKACCCLQSNLLSHMDLLIDASSIHSNYSIEQMEQMHLTKVLSDKDGFNLFLMHILSEWSTENMLAVIEFTQFKDYGRNKAIEEWQMIENNPMDPVANDLAKSLELEPKISMNISLLSNNKSKYSGKRKRTRRRTKQIKLPSHIPKSIIVYDSNLSMIDKIKLLIDKYIRVGSKFELNISAYLRKKTILKYDKMVIGQLKDDECLLIFDDVKDTIMSLMNDSFQRFQTTEEYTTFILKWKGTTDEYDE